MAFVVVVVAAAAAATATASSENGLLSLFVEFTVGDASGPGLVAAAEKAFRLLHANRPRRRPGRRHHNHRHPPRRRQSA